MIEVAHHIRKAYFDLLEGNVLLNTIEVPIYDELNEDYEGTAYIVLSTQTDTDDPNKNIFLSDHTIVIDIVTRFNTSARKYPSEVIAEQILDLVKPNVQGSGLTSLVGLQIADVRYLGSESLSVEQFDTWKVVRKILRFSHKCVQL